MGIVLDCAALSCEESVRTRPAQVRYAFPLLSIFIGHFELLLYSISKLDAISFALFCKAALEGPAAGPYA